MNKFKTVYDKHHHYYKCVPNLNISSEIIEEINFETDFFGYNLSYKGLERSMIGEYVGIYHLCGRRELKNRYNLTEEQVNAIQEIYLKSKKETEKIIKALDDLSKYDKKDLKLITPSLFK